jgi:ABC-type lipoprotein export system ATPase subunit
METILSGKNIDRSYVIGSASLHVLKGVTLDICEGETVSIMGESGSGKSTQLHVLGGLDTPKSGKVLFRGHDVYRMSSVRRARFRAENVGFVFQSFHLLPELDIVENVALPSMAKRAGKKGCNGTCQTAA